MSRGTPIVEWNIQVLLIKLLYLFHPMWLNIKHKIALGLDTTRSLDFSNKTIKKSFFFLFIFR